MYTPKPFAVPSAKIPSLLARIRHGNLVTLGPEGLVATLIPISHRPDPTAVPSGLGSLIGHLARVNPQWRQPQGESLLIADLVDGYLDPTQAPDFATNPKVPTWNYLTLHSYGELVVHDDPDWTRTTVAEQCAAYDFDLASLPEAAITRQLPAIVGIELRLTRVEAKAKLSQNLKPEQLRAHITGLTENGNPELAEEMAEIALPYAEDRWREIAALRTQAKTNLENR